MPQPPPPTHQEVSSRFHVSGIHPRPCTNGHMSSRTDRLGDVSLAQSHDTPMLLCAWEHGTKDTLRKRFFWNSSFLDCLSFRSPFASSRPTWSAAPQTAQAPHVFCSENGAWTYKVCLGLCVRPLPFSAESHTQARHWWLPPLCPCLSWWFLSVTCPASANAGAKKGKCIRKIYVFHGQNWSIWMGYNSVPMVFIVFFRDSWFLGIIITYKYPLHRAYIGISHRGTVVGVHPTIPWVICRIFIYTLVIYLDIFIYTVLYIYGRYTNIVLVLLSFILLGMCTRYMPSLGG